MKASLHCPCWLALLFCTVSRGTRGGAGQVCSSFRGCSRACLGLRKPVGKAANTGTLDRG